MNLKNNNKSKAHKSGIIQIPDSFIISHLKLKIKINQTTVHLTTHSFSCTNKN
ncbi:uncharacterized protein DS421_18g607440 [Arachis hypogaea]|nr:uncharacterized protein DS421_18g607440 [Arachis hypogaea]